ncbi:EAL domain-containing protein, partial [Klebsiella pneumoniae]|nr:EAL domain-containing protein [Klebsiella pneumoniae]
DRDPPHTRAFIGEFRSAYSQAHLQVITPIHALGHYVLRYMMFLGPMSLLLTLAALYLLQRWQKRKMSLAEEIRKGMAAGEFSVHYQPMCETATGKCTGAEALLRWKRGDGSSMSPAVFIRAAEEEGVIISLTQHLFSLIADDFSQRKINAPFHLGVNIAAAHLGDSGFTADVMQLRGALDTSFRL